jgi:hypothetical protein
MTKPFEKLADKWTALADRFKAECDETMSDGYRIESHQDAEKRYKAEQLRYCAQALRGVLNSQENLAHPKELSQIASNSSSTLLRLKQMYATSGYVMPDDIAWLLERAEQSVMPTEEQEALLEARVRRVRSEYENKYGHLRGELSSLQEQVQRRQRNLETCADKTQAAVERIRGALINRRKQPEHYEWETFEREIWSIVEGTLRKPGEPSS